MKRAFLFLWITLTTAHAEDWTTTDGTTYRSVRVIGHDALTVTILYDEGGGKVPISKLPIDLQKRLGFDTTHAEAQRVADQKAQALLQTSQLKARQVQQQREVAQSQKVWIEGRILDKDSSGVLTVQCVEPASGSSTKLNQIAPNYSGVASYQMEQQLLAQKIQERGRSIYGTFSVKNLPANLLPGETVAMTVYPAGKCTDNSGATHQIYSATLP